jgi:hypothetical protein
MLKKTAYPPSPPAKVEDKGEEAVKAWVAGYEL